MAGWDARLHRAGAEAHHRWSSRSADSHAGFLELCFLPAIETDPEIQLFVAATRPKSREQRRYGMQSMCRYYPLHLMYCDYQNVNCVGFNLV